MQLRFNNGQAVQFCSACLKLHGYPSPEALAAGRGARQMVTVFEGYGFCEIHFANYKNRKGE